MGTNLFGDEARIWGLHRQMFPASRIADLVGLSEGYVRGVITGVWHDNKVAGKSAKKKA